MIARQLRGLIPDPHGTVADLEVDAAATEADVAQADPVEALVAPVDPEVDVSRAETANQPRFT